MIKLILTFLGPRFLTPAGRRVLILGSFYTLLSGRAGGCHRLAHSMNKRLCLANDAKGLLLGTILPEILWDKNQCDTIRSLPDEKVANYFHEMIPHWLKEGVDESRLQKDLKEIVLFREPIAMP